MSTLYFKNSATGNKYRVVKFDREAGTVTLRGKYGEFTEKFDKEKFQRMGYSLEQGTDEDEG